MPLASNNIQTHNSVLPVSKRHAFVSLAIELLNDQQSTNDVHIDESFNSLLMISSFS